VKGTYLPAKNKEEAMNKCGHAVVRCPSVTFVYYVETAKDTVVVTVECE